MNVIIINALYIGGGAELQALFEFHHLQKKGHNVLFLTLDPALDRGCQCEKSHCNLVGHYSKIKSKIHLFMTDYMLLIRLKKIFKDFSPDIIHLHNIGYAEKTVYKSLKGYRAIQTVHDYSHICMKADMVYSNGCICYESNLRKCLSHCFSSSFNKKLKCVFYYYANREKRQYRDRYINKCIAPSKKLLEYLQKEKVDAICINNAVDMTEFAAFQKIKFVKNGKKILLYVGAINHNKGIFRLLSLYKCRDYTNIELHIIGNCDGNLSLKQEFKGLLEESGAVYDGAMKHSDVIHYLEKVFAVIIPSIWLENYPTVAIEGMITECVVCGSNRGGIPELVVDDRLLFDVMDNESIYRCLRFIDSMDEEKRRIVCEKQKLYCMEHNQEERYFGELMKCIYSF